MPVEELTQEQLDELKWNLYYIDDLKENLSVEDKEIIQNCVYSWDIPNEIVFKAYSGISFVEEDF